MSTKNKHIKWFGMKLTPAEKQKIQDLAKHHGTSQKQAVMEAVNKAIQNEPLQGDPGSIYERNKDLFGQSSNGLNDISSNPEKYMEGYGK